MTDMTTTARRLIRGAVLTLARESGSQVTQVSRGEPGAGWTEDAADPLAGIAAARHLERAAVKAGRDHARRAREDGLSWQEIGEAMGFADDPQPGMTSAAEHAFYRLASDLGSGPSFGYTCGTCLKTVMDHGPEMGHPSDQERGHAEGCARFAEEVRAYRAQWDEEDGVDG